MRSVRLIGLLTLAVLLGAACNRGVQEAPATLPSFPSTEAAADSGEVPPTTGAAASSSTTAAPDESVEPDETSSTAAADGGLPDYEVIHRLIKDGRETLVVVVEPGSYSSVRLENLVYDIVERYSPSGAIVVDDRGAADLAILEERTEEQQNALDSRLFLRIENGVEVTFYGPYADFPGLTVGS